MYLIVVYGKGRWGKGDTIYDAAIAARVPDKAIHGCWCDLYRVHPGLVKASKGNLSDGISIDWSNIVLRGTPELREHLLEAAYLGRFLMNIKSRKRKSVTMSTQSPYELSE